MTEGTCQDVPTKWCKNPYKKTIPNTEMHYLLYNSISSGLPCPDSAPKVLGNTIHILIGNDKQACIQYTGSQITQKAFRTQLESALKKYSPFFNGSCKSAGYDYQYYKNDTNVSGVEVTTWTKMKLIQKANVTFVL